MVQIGIITGSTRPGRFNIQPAQWIYREADGRADCDAVLLDLAEINLPLLDEPVSASKRQYEHEHTKRWSKMVEDIDGFIMITPEYNHSTSAALKNALDYLYHEWGHKPVCFISYGSLVGGSRSVEHLRTIVAELQMYDLREQMLFPNYWDRLDAEGRYQFEEAQSTRAQKMLDSLIFWSVHMKKARRELAKDSSA